MLGVFFYVYIICSLCLVACIFASNSKFRPLPSKNPRCAPAADLQMLKMCSKIVCRLFVNLKALQATLLYFNSDTFISVTNILLS